MRISFSNHRTIQISRGAIALVYAWFGTLKLFGLSPAEPLVESLFQHTLGWFIPFTVFYFLFALFEIWIGISILFKRFDQLNAWLIGLHLITTILPLFFLPDASWSGFLVPTLVGQYILKNGLIISSMMCILSRPNKT